MDRSGGNMTTRHARIDYWIDRLLASDPALDHLKSSVRAVLTVATATIALRALAQWLGQDPKLALLGIAVPMMSVVMLRDPQPEAQKFSLLLAVPVAAGGDLIGSLVVQHDWLSGALVLATVFVAFEVRRFGPRGTGLGMSLFYGYFFSLLLQPSLSKVHWQILLLCAGYAISYLVRFVLIPDDPQATLRHMLRALRARTSALLYELDRALAHDNRERRLEKIQNGIALLNALSLQVEEHLEQHAPFKAGSAPESDELRERMLDGEIAVEVLLSAVQAKIRSGASPPEATGRLAKLLGLLRSAVRTDAPFDAQAFDAKAGDPVLALAPGESWRLHRAARMLAHGAWRMPVPDLGKISSGSLALPSQWRGMFTLDAATRQAVRVTCACLGALLAGHLISPQRWYWSVIAAFVVFTRAMTPGQTLARAWQRVLATVAGVAAGLLIAELVQGRPMLELALLLSFIALGFYLFQLANAMFVLLLTLMLAMLYELLGRYSPDTLYLRLGETMAGAAMAVLAAVLVLPVRTGDESDGKSAELLREVAKLLRASFEAGHADSRNAVRGLDLKLQALRDALAPVTAKSYPAPKQEQRRRLHQLSALVYYIRHIYRLSDRHKAEIAHGPALACMAKRTADTIDLLAGRLERKDCADGLAAQALPQLEEGHDRVESGDEDGKDKSRLVANWLWESNELARGMLEEGRSAQGPG